MEAVEEGHPSEFQAAKAPLVEDLAQGVVSVVALLAEGALVEAALGAHQAAMEEG